MKTLLDGALDMRLAAAELSAGRVPAKAVTASATAVKVATGREMARIAPSGRFSHVGKNGAKVGVRVSVHAGLVPTALVSATGPWQLVENTTKAHTEFGRNVGNLRRRQVGDRLLLDRSKAGRFEAKQRLLAAVFGGEGAFSGANVLRLPGGIFRYRVNHPAVAGRHPWRNGVTASVPVVRRVFQESVLTSLRGIFR